MLLPKTKIRESSLSRPLGHHRSRQSSGNQISEVIETRVDGKTAEWKGERGKGGGATTTTTTTTTINRNDNDGGCSVDDGKRCASPSLRQLRDISLERSGSRRICQGKAPVLVRVILVFFWLLSHTFKIKPTLDTTLVDITPSFCLS